jgi:dTDP-glucose 4,6-dehydratase
MKILITGSKGFLGSFLKDKLKKNNQIIEYDFPKDICNFLKVNNFIKKKKPNIIIHAAAAKGAQISNKYPKKFIDVNAVGTLNLLESMRLNKITMVVYISSSGFYLRSKKIVHEDSKLHYNNPYSFGKAIGEKIVKFYSEKYNIKSLSLRPNLISGFGLKQDNLIYDIISEIKRNNTATVFGKGEHVREFIHPLDICSAIEKWIKIKKKHNYKIYNITCNRYSVVAVVKKIISYLKMGKIVYKYNKNKVFNLRLSSFKIKNEMKWKSNYNLDYIIKDNYEMFEKSNYYRN